VKNILVVEDISNLRLLMRNQLGEDGYHIHGVEGGVDALRMLKNRPDIELVILDIHLPDMNGLDMLEKLRSANENMKVLIISGYATPENIIRAKKLNVEAFFTKPIDWNGLRKKVKELLG